MDNIVGWAELGIAAGGSFAVALAVARFCLDDLFRVMAAGR
jgi:hypothetical protein